jgi:hypothetical protein
VVVTFCVSLAAAFLVSYALVRRQRPPRPKLALRPLALGLGGVIAVVCLIAALDLASWDSAAAGGGCRIGILTGQWLGALRAQSPG